MNKQQQEARLEAIKKNWEQRRQIGRQLQRIKTKLGVYSGKGGVGKTTVAVNLAAYLAKLGYSVGLMDADIDCPNASKVMGMTERARHIEGRLIPAERFGVKMISMAFFQEKEDEAIIWRGPMIHNAINQFLQMTDWGDLDFLLVDLPPGTSDSPLTVMQTLPMDGFVVVATPQKLAAMDAKRSINMIIKLNVEVLGVVENFAGEVFGFGAGEDLAREMGLSFLGRLNLRPDYRDDSQPTVMAVPEVEEEYRLIWDGVHSRLHALGKTPEQQSSDETT